MKTVVHTLGYNTPELIEEATRGLYKMNPNGDFTHVIADLRYPLSEPRESWDKVPESISVNKSSNIRENEYTATQHNSEFVSLPNKGVSGNWTSIAQLYDADVYIGADPDERPMDENWVQAITEVMKADKDVAVVSLALPELLALDGFFEKFIFAERKINGMRVWYGKAIPQWALIGISRRFIDGCGGIIPHPTLAPIYGWIESACATFMSKLGMTWVILPDFRVEHIASSPLAQEWKNFIVSEQGLTEGQITFDNWLEMKGAVK